MQNNQVMKMKQEIKKSEKYPMSKLSNIEKEMMKDILKTITKKKYYDIDSDRTLIIFGRIYFSYCASNLEESNQIEIIYNENVTKNKK